METWRAVSTYRAVRAFAGRPLDPDHLERIVRAGRRAPSSKNTQPWEFIVCQEREHLGELSRVGDYAGHIAGAAAAVALVTQETDDPDRRAWLSFDLGQAAQNMLLVAWDLGVGGVHAAVYDQSLARDLLGYPADHRCDVMFSFGYPADDSVLSAAPRRGGRRPFEEIVHTERW